MWSTFFVLNTLVSPAFLSCNQVRHMNFTVFLQASQVQSIEAYSELLKQQQEQIDLVIYGSLIPLIIVFIFLFFVVYRSRREAAFRKREFELQLSRSNMEMKALRSQVNPHFIFNCLASIQHFISKNDNRQAEYYLVRFSRLIRQVLENSTQNMVALTEDLEALEMYVEMERLRLQGRFEFDLRIDDAINPDEVFIPPLIIQPLVENAIWHGIDGDGGKAVISCSIKTREHFLECTVENPVGEHKAQKPSYKRKSLGLTLIQERLELLNSIYNTNCQISQEEVKKDYISRITRIEIPLESD